MSSLIRAARHGEFAEVPPLASVVANFSKYAKVGLSRVDLNKVGAVGTHERNYCLDTSHPHIVEDDVAANCAEWGVQIEVDENIIEAMVAINENDSES